MFGQLVPCAGGPPIPLLKQKLLVGRQRTCDIPLCYNMVSSSHCELELVKGYWHVRDLNSKNGTRVNNTAVTSVRLLPNDVLAVAQYRYTLIYTAPDDKPPPAAPTTNLPAWAKEDFTPPVSQETVRSGVKAKEQRPPSASKNSPLGELVPCAGGAPIPLRKPSMTIGRHPDCEIVLAGNTVSGRHCKLEWDDEGWSVRDLGSRNGIRVDGVIRASERLKPGSILWVASIRFKVVYPGQETGGPAAPKGPQFQQSLLEAAGLTHVRPEKFDPHGKADEDAHSRYELKDD